MGLDVVVLERARLIDPPPSDEAADRAGYHHVYVNSDFADRADTLASGYYDADNSFRFRAGSYSGYNEWRRWLAKTVFGVKPKVIWEHAEAFASTPFFELIHFSDCEGAFGPVTARKLAADFATWDERAQEAATGMSPHGDWYYALYQEFRKAFETAAEDGLVDFG